jgi:hypothetical protein
VLTQRPQINGEIASTQEDRRSPADSGSRCV